MHLSLQHSCRQWHRGEAFIRSIREMGSAQNWMPWIVGSSQGAGLRLAAAIVFRFVGGGWWGAAISSMLGTYVDTMFVVRSSSRILAEAPADTMQYRHEYQA